MSEYEYDAAGRKLNVTYTTSRVNIFVPMGSIVPPQATNVAMTLKTDYCGNMIYENGKLNRILTDVGYITFTGTTPVYHYYLKDHLGNNRVVMQENGTVEQVSHYYPFGGLMGESASGEALPYKYDGKELKNIGHPYCLNVNVIDREERSCLRRPLTERAQRYDYRARHYDAALGSMQPEAIFRVSEFNVN